MFRYNLTIQKISECKADFYKFTCGRNKDKNHLEVDEALFFIRRQGFEIRSYDLQEINKNVFKDSRKLFYNVKEMISVIGRLSVGDEIIREVKNLFKFFDSNNNNKLTAVELKSGFERLNENLTFHEVNQIFSEFDIDNDGFITFQQFLSAILQK